MNPTPMIGVVARIGQQAKPLGAVFVSLAGTGLDLATGRVQLIDRTLETRVGRIVEGLVADASDVEGKSDLRSVSVRRLTEAFLLR